MNFKDSEQNTSFRPIRYLSSLKVEVPEFEPNLRRQSGVSAADCNVRIECQNVGPEKSAYEDTSLAEIIASAAPKEQEVGLLSRHLL